MRRISKYLLLIILIFSNILAQCQYADIKYHSDSLNYYPAFRTKAVDSLTKEWIWKKIVFLPAEDSVRTFAAGEKKMRELLEKSEIKGLRVTDRTLELLDNLNNDKNSGKITALFDHYKPVFEKALRKEGLPPSLSYLTFALSSMNNTVRSYTGGAGYWQLSYPSGRKNGLQIDSYVDQRRDAVKSSAAAAKTLKSLYAIYRDWPLTLAAYTCGAANVNKALYRNGGELDFYTIYNSLPYFGRDVNDALAATLIYSQIHPHNYQLDYNPSTDTIEVSKRLHFKQLSDILKLDIDEIRFLNPIYKFDIVPAVNSIYKIILPHGMLEKFNLYEDSIYAYKDSILFNLHQRVILPPPPKGRHWATPAKAEIPENSALVYYHIKSGDNLGFIADWFDVKISMLEDWNNIYNPRRIQIGKRLKIYVPKNKASYYRRIDNMSFSQKQKLAGVSTQAAKKTVKDEKPGAGFFWYTVKEGESPYTIAKKYPGISADDILRWNNISDPRKIRPGQKLKIKKIK